MRSVTVMTLAALCGGVATGAYTYVADSNSGPSIAPPANKAETPEARAAAFTNADTGQCVNWTRTPTGQNTDFLTVDCKKPHRFEVSAREDLRAYPSSEFGAKGELPDVKRQAELSQELCVGPTMRYLEGKLDPNGRYTISPILPPESSWAEGDRTMLCGVMVQDAEGMSVETTGLTAEQDQSRVYEPDTCVQVQGRSTRVVPCTEDHTWQVTHQVDLRKIFKGDEWPDIKRQNDALNKVCTEQAENYMGGEENLYQSTLTPFWTTQPEESWVTGSRQANCALIATEGDGFATLKGDVRQQFTVNGKPPKTPPKRLPKRGDSPAPAPEGANAEGNPAP